jgi:hypothetical protein
MLIRLFSNFVFPALISDGSCKKNAKHVQKAELDIRQLLPDRRGGRPESSLSLRAHGGGTPPFWPRGG